MRYFNILAGVVLMLAGVSSSFAGQSISADSMGLSKASVFSVPTPKAYHYASTQPGESKLLPRAYMGAPPQVPHAVSDFMPITAEANMCIACHNQPGEWGKKLEKGSPTPIPPSHFTDLRKDPSKVTEQLIKARFNCNQCHVPQSNAPALVENTFDSKKH
ncbi:MAG: nitrate reductase cytochrome c-type subunit [Gallionellaceae bacterium]